MPMYDRQCGSCEHTLIDSWESVSAVDAACPKCGSATKRVWLTKPSNVITDDIPGGLEVRHGICNPDGSPRTYYSKSEILRTAKAAGWSNDVTHMPSSRGSDKSKHTTKWF